ncbi:hypothetical protein ACPPVQ_05910 [Diaminobutyricibacter sp. McL0618]|uniref:hypothetical protein n=1 Tax=Leifsonia sp. McL0618 TaxID=3415677 RepID=UPI003CE9620D
MLNGFDLDTVYAMCNAAIPSGSWGTAGAINPDQPHADSFGVADASRFFSQYDQGDPNAISIAVYYKMDDAHYDAAECIASGNPATPTITFIRFVD